MRIVALEDGADFVGWRRVARQLLAERIPPEAVSWVVSGEASLFVHADVDTPASTVDVATSKVPAAFLPLAQSLICHADPQRYGLAYRLLWRLTHGERTLLQLVTDADVVRARQAEKNVRRDAHKMKAFVRFREVKGEGGEVVYVAWFEPEHYIVERVAPFFVRRFTGMHWSILTPYRSAHWDGETLHYGPGATKADAPSEDVLEDYWRTYYASIFNPARLKVQAMKSEMPVKYWKNLPEAALISELIRNARPRTLAMVEAEATTPKKRFSAPIPLAEPAVSSGHAELKKQARECRACPLWQPATQTVFGEGPARATLMIVGDQPGDEEDLGGRPFIGPVGKLLNAALAEVGINRAAVYVTHAVKHFKFEQRGRLRLQMPHDDTEQRACHAWLEAEMSHVRPCVVLCLGAAAAKAVIAPDFVLSKARGRWFDASDGRRVLATVRPYDLLRLREPAKRESQYRIFIDDLRLVADALDEMSQ